VYSGQPMTIIMLYIAKMSLLKVSHTGAGSFLTRYNMCWPFGRECPILARDKHILDIFKVRIIYLIIVIIYYCVGV